MVAHSQRCPLSIADENTLPGAESLENRARRFLPVGSMLPGKRQQSPLKDKQCDGEAWGTRTTVGRDPKAWICKSGHFAEQLPSCRRNACAWCSVRTIKPAPHEERTRADRCISDLQPIVGREQDCCTSRTFISSMCSRESEICLESLRH